MNVILNALNDVEKFQEEHRRPIQSKGPKKNV